MTRSSSMPTRTKSSGSKMHRRSVERALGAAESKPTKLAILTDRLSRSQGASLKELIKATGWLPHSVRGAMPGALEAKGPVIVSEAKYGVRRYRIKASE